MKKFLTLFIAITLGALSVSAQITIAKEAPEQDFPNGIYDSTAYITKENIYLLKGQRLFFPPLRKALSSFGYINFYVDANLKSTYMPKGHSFSSFTENAAIENRYFDVIDVIKRKNEGAIQGLLGDDIALKLKYVEDDVIIYWRYDSFGRYVIVGHFEKLKREYIGKRFISRGRTWISTGEDLKDINSGNTAQNKAGMVLKCVDITLDNDDYSESLVLENEHGEKILLFYGYADNQEYVFTDKEAERIKKKYGIEIWNMILSNKVKIGISEDVAILSWGNPQKINYTTTSGVNREQWVYGDGQYLYFTNGKLSSMQN